MITTPNHTERRRHGLAAPILVLAALMASASAEGQLAPAALAETLAAHPVPPRALEATNYLVIDLPSLGGSISEGRSINNLGIVSGYSDEEGGETRHATAWLGRRVFDLETLGGPNSAVLFRGMNTPTTIVGISETAELDPRGEDWSCSFFFPGEPTGHVCLGFAWQQGRMKEMPTLGGTHGFAADVNNAGLVVGWAENDVVDPDCEPPQVLQFRGVVWNPRSGKVRELPPFPGDKVSTGNAINDRGQIVGISGICDQAVGRASAIHAVLWDDEEIIDLGNLGEQEWNTPLAINRDGEVVGFAGLDSGFLGAFYWNEAAVGGMQALGTLNEDHVHSEAWGINKWGRAVGLSCDEDFLDCRAFVWEDDVMTDLNDLAPGYPNHLRTARAINDFGMITGQSVDSETGESHAYLAIPVPAAVHIEGE